MAIHGFFMPGLRAEGIKNMPVIGYIGGPTFAGESAERDAAYFDFACAVNDAPDAMRDLARNGSLAARQGLTGSFLHSAEDRKALERVHSAMQRAMNQNRGVDPEQYNKVATRAREWAPMFEHANLPKLSF